MCFIVIHSSRADSNFDFYLTPSWDSHYVTQGGNNLDSGGLLSLDLALSKSDFEIGLWLARGDSQDYKEINLYAGYGFSIYSLEAYLNFTHLIFPEEAKNQDQDNEIGFGISYSSYQWLQPSLDYIWGSEAKGGYIELSLRSDLIASESRYQITPYMLRAYDFGYVSEDHDELNHTEVGFEVSALVAADTSIELGLHHSWAGRNLKRDDLDDVSWVNIGLSAEF